MHELGRDADIDFIVMEHIEGPDLRRALAGRPMTPESVAKLGEQVARALARAHRKGLVHRDLKPGNILMTPEGDAKVVDFGLATLCKPHGMLDSALTAHWPPAFGDAEHTEALNEASRVAIMGTLAYMSPEQVRGESVDARSDIFSLGVVLYEMATGRRPFSGATQEALAQSLLECRPAPPSSLTPAIPQNWIASSRNCSPGNGPSATSLWMIWPGSQTAPFAGCTGALIPQRIDSRLAASVPGTLARSAVRLIGSGGCGCDRRLWRGSQCVRTIRHQEAQSTPMTRS